MYNKKQYIICSTKEKTKRVKENPKQGGISIDDKSSVLIITIPKALSLKLDSAPKKAEST